MCGLEVDLLGLDDEWGVFDASVPPPDALSASQTRQVRTGTSGS